MIKRQIRHCLYHSRAHLQPRPHRSNSIMPLVSRMVPAALIPMHLLHPRAAVQLGGGQLPAQDLDAVRWIALCAPAEVRLTIHYQTIRVKQLEVGAIRYLGGNRAMTAMTVMKLPRSSGRRASR